ncbi:hypothetical protein HPB51_020972 [Rhipicephalus microplus]|uniref:Uncharacterized protein n=1 Tax=Rhipicephalus microplus TaxID=6941 RepID=A0A9J6DXJ6_RHIMP|nr:hypothetical protein HPB51_020972 [Rhipicephalus microplus]
MKGGELKTLAAPPRRLRKPNLLPTLSSVWPKGHVHMMCLNKPNHRARPLVLAARGFGAITGGALVARWNLHYAGMIRLCMYSCCFSWFGNLAFVFNCPERTYTTPDGYVGAPECSCVNGTLNDLADVSADWLLQQSVQVIRSRCPANCPLLVVYLLGVLLATLAVFLNAAPATEAAIRLHPASMSPGWHCGPDMPGMAPACAARAATASRTKPWLVACCIRCQSWLALSMLLYYLSLLAHHRHLRMRKDSIPIPVLYVGSRSQTIASPASLSETTVSPVDPAEPSPGQ